MIALARIHCADYGLYIRNGMKGTPPSHAPLEYLDFLISTSTGTHAQWRYLIASSAFDLDFK